MKATPGSLLARWRFVCAVITVSVLAACTRQAETLSPTQREAIQTRVTTHFQRTVLFQPRDADSTVAVRLAPLIVQELADTNIAGLWRDQFAWNDAGPLVLSEVGTTVVPGRSHDQVFYFWSYPPNESARSPALKAQGIRITLNAAGEPVIWEVLADSTGADILYVAQSLELAARAEFGAPLPSRKFSIERSVAEAPHTVVANVIDDGPLPMGPVVYLRQGNHDVSTLICRCMASQGGTLLGQTNYELQLSATQTNAPATFRPGELEQRLRLPRSF
ncbi:MAG TPA: hypothetical protein VFZ59_16195 [Verrucomicrobiae bacterium]|nr:hypothetical protein [Verrucomicrobiae bacterium]